jgi:hypothetical protein
MTAVSQLREQLSDEYPYETYHNKDWKTLGRSIWKYCISMCMNDMGKGVAMSLHDECLTILIYA